MLFKKGILTFFFMSFVTICGWTVNGYLLPSQRSPASGTSNPRAPSPASSEKALAWKSSSHAPRASHQAEPQAERRSWSALSLLTSSPKRSDKGKAPAPSTATSNSFHTNLSISSSSRSGSGSYHASGPSGFKSQHDYGIPPTGPKSPERSPGSPTSSSGSTGFSESGPASPYTSTTASSSRTHSDIVAAWRSSPSPSSTPSRASLPPTSHLNVIPPSPSRAHVDSHSASWSGHFDSHISDQSNAQSKPVHDSTAPGTSSSSRGSRGSSAGSAAGGHRSREQLIGKRGGAVAKCLGDICGNGKSAASSSARSSPSRSNDQQTSPSTRSSSTRPSSAARSVMQSPRRPSVSPPTSSRQSSGSRASVASGPSHPYPESGPAEGAHGHTAGNGYPANPQRFSVNTSSDSSSEQTSSYSTSASSSWTPSIRENGRVSGSGSGASPSPGAREHNSHRARSTPSSEHWVSAESSRGAGSKRSVLERGGAVSKWFGGTRGSSKGSSSTSSSVATGHHVSAASSHSGSLHSAKSSSSAEGSFHSALASTASSFHSGARTPAHSPGHQSSNSHTSSYQPSTTHTSSTYQPSLPLSSDHDNPHGAAANGRVQSPQQFSPNPSPQSSENSMHLSPTSSQSGVSMHATPHQNGHRIGEGSGASHSSSSHSAPHARNLRASHRGPALAGAIDSRSISISRCLGSLCAAGGHSGSSSSTSSGRQRMGAELSPPVSSSRHAANPVAHSPMTQSSNPRTAARQSNAADPSSSSSSSSSSGLGRGRIHTNGHVTSAQEFSSNPSPQSSYSSFHESATSTHPALSWHASPHRNGHVAGQGSAASIDGVQGLSSGPPGPVGSAASSPHSSHSGSQTSSGRTRHEMQNGNLSARGGVMAKCFGRTCGGDRSSSSASPSPSSSSRQHASNAGTPVAGSSPSSGSPATHNSVHPASTSQPPAHQLSVAHSRPPSSRPSSPGSGGAFHTNGHTVHTNGHVPSPQQYSPTPSPESSEHSMHLSPTSSQSGVSMHATQHQNGHIAGSGSAASVVGAHRSHGNSQNLASPTGSPTGSVHSSQTFSWSPISSAGPGHDSEKRGIVERGGVMRNVSSWFEGGPDGDGTTYPSSVTSNYHGSGSSSPSTGSMRSATGSVGDSHSASESPPSQASPSDHSAQWQSSDYHDNSPEASSFLAQEQSNRPHNGLPASNLDGHRNDCLPEQFSTPAGTSDISGHVSSDDALSRESRQRPTPNGHVSGSGSASMQSSTEYGAHGLQKRFITGRGGSISRWFGGMRGSNRSRTRPPSPSNTSNQRVSPARNFSAGSSHSAASTTEGSFHSAASGSSDGPFHSALGSSASSSRSESRPAGSTSQHRSSSIHDASSHRHANDRQNGRLSTPQRSSTPSTPGTPPSSSGHISSDSMFSSESWHVHHVNGHASGSGSAATQNSDAHDAHGAHGGSSTSISSGSQKRFVLKRGRDLPRDARNKRSRSSSPPRLSGGGHNLQHQSSSSHRANSEPSVNGHHNGHVSSPNTPSTTHGTSDISGHVSSDSVWSRFSWHRPTQTKSHAAGSGSGSSRSERHPSKQGGYSAGNSHRVHAAATSSTESDAGTHGDSHSASSPSTASTADGPHSPHSASSTSIGSGAGRQTPGFSG
ncbi:unnamed protein product [Sympodiomycopsis kandeliae]